MSEQMPKEIAIGILLITAITAVVFIYGLFKYIRGRMKGSRYDADEGLSTMAWSFLVGPAVVILGGLILFFCASILWVVWEAFKTVFMSSPVPQ